jgi:hypothetical protein
MNTRIVNTLSKIHQLIGSLNNNWILIGSTSLFLQGYPVEPNDIDILCPTTETIKIEHLLKDYQLKLDANISRDKFRSVFSNYVIDDVKIEVMGDLEINTPSGWIKVLDKISHAETVLFNGLTYNVPSKAD